MSGAQITRQRAEEALRRHRDRLEEMVEERTQELKEAQEALIRRERLATLGQLTATVSHELRNPLGAIRNAIHAVEILSSDEDPRLKRSIETAVRGIIRCDNIVGELLEFTRVSELECQPSEVDEWLDALLNEYRFSPGIVLRRSLASGADLAFDRDRFRRAVLNVLDNACHAMRDDAESDSGERRHILNVSTRSTHGRLEVTVEDTGAGISTNALVKIFEPLFSTKNFGVGLGLPIVKQIMEQHGGGVEIASTLGQGTKVVLWFPLRAQSTGELQ